MTASADADLRSPTSCPVVPVEIQPAVRGQAGDEPPALLRCHSRNAPMDEPQSIGDSQVGQSASSSVIGDSQFEHRSAGSGSGANTASARPVGLIAEVSFI
jgi:hypothetical protein